MLRVTIEEGDAPTQECDVIVTWQSMGVYGWGGGLAKGHAGERRVRPGDHLLLPLAGSSGPRHVLIMGIDLADLGYKDLRDLALRALDVLSRELRRARTVVMTVYGAGLGLDDTVCFRMLLQGVAAAETDGAIPRSLQAVRFVDGDAARVRRLSLLLGGTLESAVPSGYRQHVEQLAQELAEKGQPTAHGLLVVFVAMPFDEELDDHYTLGIATVVHELGCLCTRMDEQAYAGHVVEEIKRRIGESRLVIADITGNNPNVYLEIGYAWGIGKPVVLIRRRTSDPAFDVAGHKCVVFPNVSALRGLLKRELSALLKQSGDEVQP